MSIPGNTQTFTLGTLVLSTALQGHCRKAGSTRLRIVSPDALGSGGGTRALHAFWRTGGVALLYA